MSVNPHDLIQMFGNPIEKVEIPGSELGYIYVAKIPPTRTTIDDFFDDLASQALVDETESAQATNRAYWNDLAELLFKDLFAAIAEGIKNLSFADIDKWAYESRLLRHAKLRKARRRKRERWH